MAKRKRRQVPLDNLWALPMDIVTDSPELYAKALLDRNIHLEQTVVQLERKLKTCNSKLEAIRNSVRR